jgi:hypothetical protein
MKPGDAEKTNKQTAGVNSLRPHHGAVVAHVTSKRLLARVDSNVLGKVPLLGCSVRAVLAQKGLLSAVHAVVPHQVAFTLRLVCKNEARDGRRRGLTQRTKHMLSRQNILRMAIL